jgi:hypothetical protein
MPDLIAQCTPPSNPLPPSLYAAPPSEPPEPPAPPPPTGSASKWEPYEGFRFTFLLHFTLEEQAALQMVAQLLYDAVLEKPRPADLPEQTAPWMLWEMRTALSEMRYLEGYLGTIFDAHRLSSLSPAVEKLSKMAGGIASDLEDVIHTFTQELRKWEQRHGRRSR